MLLSCILVILFSFFKNFWKWGSVLSEINSSLLPSLAIFCINSALLLSKEVCLSLRIYISFLRIIMLLLIFLMAFSRYNYLFSLIPWGSRNISFTLSFFPKIDTTVITILPCSSILTSFFPPFSTVPTEFSCRYSNTS